MSLVHDTSDGNNHIARTSGFDSEYVVHCPTDVANILRAMANLRWFPSSGSMEALLAAVSKQLQGFEGQVLNRPLLTVTPVSVSS